MNNYTYSNHSVNTSNGITDYTQSPETRAIYDSVTVNNFAESVTTASVVKKDKHCVAPLKKNKKKKSKISSMLKSVGSTMRSWLRRSA